MRVSARAGVCVFSAVYLWFGLSSLDHVFRASSRGLNEGGIHSFFPAMDQGIQISRSKKTQRIQRGRKFCTPGPALVVVVGAVQHSDPHQSREGSFLRTAQAQQNAGRLPAATGGTSAEKGLREIPCSHHQSLSPSIEQSSENVIRNSIRPARRLQNSPSEIGCRVYCLRRMNRSLYFCRGTRADEVDVFPVQEGRDFVPTVPAKPRHFTRNTFVDVVPLHPHTGVQADDDNPRAQTPRHTHPKPTRHRRHVFFPGDGDPAGEVCTSAHTLVNFFPLVSPRSRRFSVHFPGPFPRCICDDSSQHAMIANGWIRSGVDMHRYRARERETGRMWRLQLFALLE